MSNETNNGETTTVVVKLQGSAKVKLVVPTGQTVADVLRAAAETLGVTIDTSKVDILDTSNGEQLDADAVVQDGDSIAAAPKAHLGAD